MDCGSVAFEHATGHLEIADERVGIHTSAKESGPVISEDAVVDKPVLGSDHALPDDAPTWARFLLTSLGEKDAGFTRFVLDHLGEAPLAMREKLERLGVATPEPIQQPETSPTAAAAVAAVSEPTEAPVIDPAARSAPSDVKVPTLLRSVPPVVSPKKAAQVKPPETRPAATVRSWSSGPATSQRPLQAAFARSNAAPNKWGLSDEELRGLMAIVSLRPNLRRLFDTKIETVTSWDIRNISDIYLSRLEYLETMLLERAERFSDIPRLTAAELIHSINLGPVNIKARLFPWEGRR